MEILYPDEAYQIMGACFEVYKELGCGFLESVYQEALELELASRNIPYQPKVELKLRYKGRLLEKTFEADIICFDKIILELKAARDLDDDHRSQLHNYLKATGMRLGLLVNFGHHPGLQYQRIAR
jgi:GxxExxY protein